MTRQTKLSLTLSAFLLVIAAIIWAWPAQASTRDVVIAHGYTTNLGSASEWNKVYGTLKARFEADGYTVHALLLPSNDPQRNAQYICDYVAGMPDVALVGHSMGGMSARFCVEHLGGQAAFVGLIDVPHDGLSGWMVCLGQPSMCRGSSFIRALQAEPNTPPPTYWLDLTLDPPGLPDICHMDIPGSFSTSTHLAAPGRADVYAWLKQGIETQDVCTVVAATPTPTATNTPLPTATTAPAVTATPAPSCSFWERLFRRC